MQNMDWWRAVAVDNPQRSRGENAISYKIIANEDNIDFPLDRIDSSKPTTTLSPPPKRPKLVHLWLEFHYNVSATECGLQILGTISAHTSLRPMIGCFPFI